MLTFDQPKTSSNQFMRFSKVFPQQETAAPKRDKRVQAVQTAEQLLQLPERIALIQEIQDLCAASSKNYQIYYESLIKRFAEFIQLISDFDHPSATWLDNHLRLAKTALKMREQFLLVGESLHPIVNEEEALWHYVIFSSALLRKIGLLATQYQVSICNEQGVHQSEWQPFAGQMNAQGNYYKLRDIVEQTNPYTNSLGQLLARQIMPEEGFLWIAKNPLALATWLGIVQGESEGGVSHRIVAVSEKQLYELAKQEALLEQLYRAHKLEDLLKLSGLSEQQILETLPDLHGIENQNNEIATEFFEWLKTQNDENREGLMYLMSERQYLLSPIALEFLARECPGMFNNWFNFYKRSLNLGFTVLTASDRALQSFLAHSTQLLRTLNPAAKNTTELFHQTAQQQEQANTAAVTQEAKNHEQALKHTVEALNNQGLMVGSLFGQAHYHAHMEKSIAQGQQESIGNKQAQTDAVDHRDSRIAEYDFLYEQLQKIHSRQHHLRGKIQIQYPGPGVEIKSSFSYSRNI